MTRPHIRDWRATFVLFAIFAALLAAASPASADTATVLSTKDHFVRSKTPATVQASGALKTKGAASDTEYAYLGFTVSQIPAGATNVTATLEVWSNSAVTRTSRVFAAANTLSTGVDWTESNVTWDNRPAAGAQLATHAPTSSAGYVPFNVSSLVNANGTYTLQLRTDNNNEFQWQGDEQTNKPRLVLSWTPEGPPPSGDLLTWAPPGTTGYTVLNLDGPSRNDTNNTIDLADNTDYVINLNGVFPVGLRIRGGRNIVIIGGEFNITQKWGDGGSEQNQGALLFMDSLTAQNPGRIIHVEGIYGHGYYFSDGIRGGTSLGDPPSRFDLRVQNTRIEQGMWGRDTGEGPGTHPDIIQLYGGAASLKVDKLTGISTYQGFLVYNDRGQTDEVWMRRVDMRNQDPNNTSVEYGDPNAPTPRPANYFDTRPNSLLNWGGSGVYDVPNMRIDTPTVWFDHHFPFATTGIVSPSANVTLGADALGTYLYYDSDVPQWKDWSGATAQAARIYEGSPAGGDYVPATVPGDNYVSPGYLP
jgi:hypothetical protein